MKKVVVFILVGVLTSLGAIAQSNEGTDFWMGFMNHIDENMNNKVLMLTSRYDASGTVSIPLQNWSQDFTISANEVTLIDMPASAETFNSEIVRNTGVHITSDLPISVYAHQYFARRSEAALVLPVQSIGQDYLIMSYFGFDANNGEAYPSEFLIIATEDETMIEITVSDRTLKGKVAGTTFTVELDEGESYQVQAGGGAAFDLTSSKVTSDKPIAVFGGAKWSQVSTTCFARDNLYEQMYPVETWGKKFALVRHQGATTDRIRIMASEDDTQVFLAGNFLTTLNAGEYVERTFSSASAFIEAYKPIMVAQYIQGSGCNGIASGNGDPSMVLLNSVEQTRDSVTLYSSPFENIVENYITIIVNSLSINSVTLDGAPVTGFTEVTGNDEYSYVGVKVSAGNHFLTASGCGLIATAYGYGEIESYAYSGGASFRSINANPIPVGACLNDTVIFDTGLPDDRAFAIWDFGDGSGSNLLAPSHIYDALGTYRVRLILTDICLKTVDTIEQDLIVTLRQQVFAGEDQRLCEGASVELIATDLPEATYTWTGPQDYFSEEQFPTILDMQPNMSGEYSVVGTISGCSTYPNVTEVFVRPTPDPELREDTSICDGGPILLESPYLYDRYQWASGSSMPSFLVTEPGEYILTVTDDLNCIGSDTVSIVAFCPPQLFVPTGFTPNNDGFNDLFAFRASYMIRFEIQVFNRWGQIVFATDNPDQYWDGTLPGGKLASEGVYVWQANFDYDGRDGFTYVRRQSGTITLVR
ncbi:MAG: gliding motility-associated C-terminal domain-containing protein [Bacteroidota bacterium]